MMDNELANLVVKVKSVCNNAYAPYSNFKVGCIITSEGGNWYSGCNVENISFGLTNCAERTAVFKGISEEGPSFKISRVVIYTPTENPVSPCGACRQVLSEFGDDFEIICICDSSEEIRTNMNDLLPILPDIEIKK